MRGRDPAPPRGRPAERDRLPARRRDGHRREHDDRLPTRSFAARVDGLVRDVGTFRAVALRDLVARQFDGHPFVARRGVAEAVRRGWVEERRAEGPRGGAYSVLVATPAGAARAEALWRRAGRDGQRAFAGAVKAAEVGHDVAVYRAAALAEARIAAEGGRVTRVRIDAELRGVLAARGERARRRGGRAAAEAERGRAAAELGLPVEDGRVVVPDAQIEYEAAGRTARCNVEVASEHYRGRAIRSKAAAGFRLYATTARAAAAVRRALGGAAERGRRPGRLRGDYEVIEL